MGKTSKRWVRKESLWVKRVSSWVQRVRRLVVEVCIEASVDVREVCKKVGRMVGKIVVN